MFKLTEAPLNKKIIFVGNDRGCSNMKRLTDMGLIPGEPLRVIQAAGTGPVKIMVKGTTIALGRGIAERILVDEPGKVMKKTVRVALAGNPNSGKSTLFNNLTGSRQQIGNYPGVTVEKKKVLPVCGIMK